MSFLSPPNIYVDIFLILIETQTVLSKFRKPEEKKCTRYLFCNNMQNKDISGVETEEISNTALVKRIE